MSIGFTVGLVLLVLLGAAVLLLLGLVWFIFQRPLAKVKGEIKVRGLAQAVEVVRDRWGVAHLYAETEQDALFAQGYVHAQDRLFQMEVTRRLAQGRMAEQLGPLALEPDRWSRIIGFWRAAAGDLAELDAAERATLDAYAAGVNAYMEANRYFMPAEFTLLGFKPEPWTAQDSLGVLKVMAWALSQNWEGELLRTQLAAQLGTERTLEIDPDYPESTPTVVPPSDSRGQEALAEAANRLAASYEAVSRALSDLGLPVALGQGGGASNNWVAGPQRTTTRRPLLANDPHLTMSMPAIWYQNHITVKDGRWQVTGASLPGVPGVVVGHNERIAWGITAGRADTQDLYVEWRHPDQPETFRCGEQWQPARVLEEAIAVRGQAEPHVERVVITRHGPLITGLLPAHEAQSLPPLALRWSGHSPSLSFRGLWRLQKAHDWASFRDALSLVHEPSLNMVYADVDGNIGYQYVGRIPQRRHGHGLTPSPGWVDEAEWDGWVPFDRLPSVLNPPQGFLATANNRPAVGADTPFLGADWMPGYRAARIERMLQSKPRLGVRDFQNMQMDVYSVEAEALVPFMVMAEGVHPLERRIVRELEGWGLRLEVDSFPAAAYEVMRLHLLHLVFGDKLGPLAAAYKGKAHSDVFASSAFSGKAGVALLRLLENEHSWWYHDAATGRARTRDEVLQLALRQTAQTLYELIGKEPRKWAWGKVHQVEFAHLLGRNRLLRWFFNRGQFPVGGDEHTVWMTAYDLTLPFGLVTVSASFRMVLDVGDWDRSTALLPTGQSGQPFSTHYADFIDMWREGEQHAMPWTRPAVDEVAENTLWLRPDGGEP